MRLCHTSDWHLGKRLYGADRGAEARAALAEGIVADADLLDAGAIFGTGFPPFRGGPIHYLRGVGARSDAALAPAAQVG
jgi:hypothetical protein